MRIYIIIILAFISSTADAQSYGRFEQLNQYEGIDISCAEFTNNETIILGFSNPWCKPVGRSSASIVEVTTNGDVVRKANLDQLINDPNANLRSLTYNENSQEILLIFTSVNSLGEYNGIFVIINEYFEVKNVVVQELPTNLYMQNISCKWDAEKSMYYGCASLVNGFTSGGSMIFKLMDNGDLNSFVYNEEVQQLTDIFLDKRRDPQFVTISSTGLLSFWDTSLKFLKSIRCYYIDGRSAPGTSVLPSPRNDTDLLIHSRFRFYRDIDKNSPTFTSVSNKGFRRSISIQSGKDYDEPFGYKSFLNMGDNYYLGTFQFNYTLNESNPKKRFNVSKLNDTLGVVWNKSYEFEDELHSINGMAISKAGDIFVYGRTEHQFNIVKSAVGYLLNSKGEMHSLTVNDIEDYNYTVFPNPIVDKFNISIGRPLDTWAKVDVINQYGSIVYGKDDIGIKVIDASQWPSGIYFVRLTDKLGKVYSKTVIKR